MGQQRPTALEEARDLVGHLDPARITDMESFNRYTELCNNPIFSDKRKWIEPSKGKRVCIAWFPTHLKERIKHLPEAEQKAILAQHKIYKHLMAIRNAALRKAYGTYVTNNGKPSIKGSIFDQREREIIELFGRMFTAPEVLEICVKDWQLPATLKSVGDFRKIHWDEISKLIEEHKRTYSDIRLGYKRSRLEELTWMYQMRKRIYEATKKGDDHRLLLMTIEQIRKEAEGDAIRIDGQLNIQMEKTIEEHMQQELFKNMNLKEIIVGRVAARAGVSSEKLLTELNKSYYAKFHQAEDIEHEEVPPPPSSQTYDFDKIRRINEQRVQRERAENQALKRKQGDDVSNVNKGAEAIKEALIAKLKKKQESATYVKNSLTGKFIDKSNPTYDE